MKLYWIQTISEVAEKSVTVGGKRSADGKAELQIESAGWYIRIGNVSHYVGNTEPPFKKGDLVRITIEHEQEQNPNANQEAQI